MGQVRMSEQGREDDLDVWLWYEGELDLIGQLRMFEYGTED